MNSKEIINALKEGKTEYLKIQSFSQNPGIYAVFFHGDHFPVFGDVVSKNQIIYIGKTESSQEKRDAKTHFTSGKTGSSTLRKSIGSLFCSSENLKPIPRNEIDYQNNRFSQFKFDNPSEIKITNWMKKNLSLSFFEYPASKQEIEDLETELINEIVPILNISKNHKNPYKNDLQKLRKNCAIIAVKEYTDRNHKQILDIIPNLINKKSNIMKTSGKYIDLWTNQRQSIKNKLAKISTKQFIQLNEEDFQKVGNRSSYSFNLEYQNGIVVNNIKGSAVARDLACVLESSIEIKNILKEGHYKINMDTNYCLWIQKLS